METIWKLLGSLVILLLLQLCNGLPLDLEHTYADAHTQFLTGLVAILLTVCSVVCLAGCLCCQRGNGFKEFHDSPVAVSVASNLDHGHINPIANSEFTIFTPLSPPHQNNNVFLANQQIITRVDEDYRSGDIDVTSWFNSGEKEFPRTQLKYIRELGKGWFGRVVEGAATGLPPPPSTITNNTTPSTNGIHHHHHPLSPTSESHASAPTAGPDARFWAPVVVRILDAGAGAPQRLHFLHDAAIYRAPRPHDHVLRLEGRCLDTVPLLLLQEYCPKGDLKHYLIAQKASGDKFLSSELPLRWCWQLASALKHLHQYKLAHTDLAMRNCQLDEQLQLKLGDYGTTVAKYPEDYYHGSEVVPVRWCAPETVVFTPTTIQLKKVNAEGNIWSLGICMWEIFEFGAQPYDCLNNDEVVSQVLGPANVRLPKPKCKIIYTDYIYRLMQLCWSTVESRPAITQIELMLLDLLQVYQHTQDPASENSSNAPVSLQDFDNRWDTFKPNNIVKMDNQQDAVTVLNFNNTANSSPSLKNLAGSLDDLLEGGQQLDSWLENVASSTGDLSYVKGLSDAINDLDNAIAMENVSSSESSSRPNSGNVKHQRSKIQFKLGPIQSKSNYLMSSSDNKNSLLLPRTSSESETEDENWKRKIERGAYTEKVRQKSRSVADLMVLTHIDTSESDSETMPSLDTRVNHKNSLLFGSEGNLINVETRFQEELRKLQVERRDSLLFVPERNSLENTAKIEEKATPTHMQVYNVYNVVTISPHISPVKVPNVNFDEIINYEKDLEMDVLTKKADSPDIVTSKYLKETTVEMPDIISSCNGTVDAGSSNASTETLDKLDDIICPQRQETSSTIIETPLCKPILNDKISELPGSSNHTIKELSSPVIQVGFSNVTTTSDNLDLHSETISSKYNYNAISDRFNIGSGVVPKLTELIENNAALMDYIIEKYDSDGGLPKENDCVNRALNFGEVSESCQSDIIEAVNLNVDNKICYSDKFSETETNFELVEAINPNINTNVTKASFVTECEQFVDELLCDAVTIYTDKQHNLIQTTQDFINTEIVQYEDSNRLVHFDLCSGPDMFKRHEGESSVILGACDDYSIDLYASLKTAVDNGDIPVPLQQIYTSTKSDEAASRLNFSLETWDKFLGNSFERHDEEDTGMFSQPQSLLFLENERVNAESLSQIDSDNIGILSDVDKGSFLQQLTDLDDVETVDCAEVASSDHVLNRTFDLPTKCQDDVNDVPSDMNNSDDGLDVSDIKIEMEDGEPGLNETYELKDEDSVWQTSSTGGWFLHPQVDGLPTGLMDPSGSGLEEDGYVGFAMDDDIMAAIRNELLIKLPHAQRAANEQTEEPDESEPPTSDSKNEIVMRYNYYNMQLSPIPEESYSELLNSGQSTPNCTVNTDINSSTSGDTTDDGDTWSESLEHSAKVSDSEEDDDSPQLPVDSSSPRVGLLHGCHAQRRAEDEPCTSAMRGVDLLEDVIVKVEEEEVARDMASLPSPPTTLPLISTITTSFPSPSHSCSTTIPRLTLDRPPQPPPPPPIHLEESSSSSDTGTYVTASDNTLSFGKCVGTAVIVPPLNSPEDRLPWRPVGDVVSGEGMVLGGGLTMTSVQQQGSLDDDEYELLPSGDDIEISSAFLDESGAPSSDEKQLSQDSDTLPMDTAHELHLQKQLQQQQQSQLEQQNGSVVSETDNITNCVDEPLYCTIGNATILPNCTATYPKKANVLQNEYDDVMFHDHDYINQDQGPMDKDTNSSKLEYDYASYMNQLNTKHNTKSNTINNTNLTNEYDEVPSELDNTIEEYASNEVPDQNNSENEYEIVSNEKRDYVNIPASSVRDYVNIAARNVAVETEVKDDFKQVLVSSEVISPDVELNADVLDEEDMYNPLEDIRFEGPAADMHLMSTSFSDSNDLCDEHDEDWDSGSDTRSSSSGEFIWKHTEQISPLDEIREESEDTSSGSEGDDADGIEFVPSAWDKYATPSKSALRSPERTMEPKPRGVWFKKQKYYCIYEYPREPESPLPQTFDLWQPAPEYPMCPADWDVDTSAQAIYDDIPSSSADVTCHADNCANTHVPEYNIDEDFYIRAAAKPFDLMYTGSGHSQFFPGRLPPPDGVDYWLRPNGSSAGNNNAGNSSGYNSELSTTPTPDSGAEDGTTGSLLSDASEQGSTSHPLGPPTLKSLCQIAAGALNPNNGGRSKADMEIGGLRHTRNRLKLDLPPSPSAFTTARTFNVGGTSADEDDEPIVKRQPVTFSTFGKSRFLVQQVATPPADSNSATNGKNVSFEALPYKPRLELIEAHQYNNNHCSSNSSQNSSREDLYSAKDHANTGNANTKVEVVRGEASLLDSADEDSGIESSTLDRKRKSMECVTLPLVNGTLEI